jgi:hypothetical protein
MKTVHWAVCAAMAVGAGQAVATSMPPSGQFVVTSGMTLDTLMGSGLGWGVTPTFDLSGGVFNLLLVTESNQSLFDVVLAKVDPVTGFETTMSGVGSQSADFKTITYSFQGLASGTYLANVLGVHGAEAAMSASYTNVTPIPEASSWAMFLAGGAVAAAAVRRRRV